MSNEQEIPTQINVVPQDSVAGQIVRLETRRRLLKQRYEQLKVEHEVAKKELAEFKARPVDPTLEELRTQLSEVKHRKVFDKLAGDAKARAVALDDLWRLSGYQIDPHAEGINEEALKGVIAEQQKIRPYLFDALAGGESAASETKAPPKMEPGPGWSRGNLVRDTGKFYARRRGPGSVRDPQWMQMNQPAYDAAVKNGTLEYID